MCVLFTQFRLFCRHPMTGVLVEKPLEVHMALGLSDVVAASHKVKGAFKATYTLSKTIWLWLTMNCYRIRIPVAFVR